MNINIEIGEIKLGKGYGKDMSVNALLSLEKEEKPITKWNKVEIIEGILDVNENLSSHILSCIPEICLKDKFLSYKGWHHVGGDYNQVGFYSLNKEYIKEIGNLDLQNILIDNSKITRKFKEEIKKAEVKHKSRYKNKQNEKKLEYNISKVMPYTDYNSVKQLKKDIHSGNVNINDLLNLREDVIKCKWRNLLASNINSKEIEHYLDVYDIDTMENIVS